MSRISDRLTALAACLCAQIEQDGLPGTCFCGVIPGEAAVAEYGGDCSDKCGMAWVRLGAMYPATGLGALDETPNNCSASLGFDIEIGIMRCIRVPEPEYPLTPAELSEATSLQADDALTMWRAVLCCEAIPNKDIMLTGYSPMGPMGGMIGGTWGVRTVL